MGPLVIGFHLESFQSLLTGLIVLTGVQVMPSQASGQTFIERVQFHGSLALGYRLSRSIHGHKIVGVSMVNICLARAQLKGTLEFSFGACEVPVVMQLSQGQDTVGIGESAVLLQSGEGPLPHFRE